MIVLRPTVIRRNGEVKKLSPGWVPSPPLQTRSLAEESLQEGWSGCKGVDYIVEPATAEMVKLIAKAKLVWEEILTPTVSKKFTFIQFSLPLYSIKSGVILTFYTFHCNKKPKATPRVFYSINSIL